METITKDAAIAEIGKLDRWKARGMLTNRDYRSELVYLAARLDVAIDDHPELVSRFSWLLG